MEESSSAPPVESCSSHEGQQRQEEEKEGSSRGGGQEEENSSNPLELFVKEYKEGPMIHKWPHYLPLYHKHLSRYRGTNVTLVEVGVQSGGSILMWKHYLGRRMHYIGIDNNPQVKRFQRPGVDIVIGDQSNRDFWKSFRASHPHVDVLIDDGGHEMQQQIVTFEEMYGHLAPSGVYVCEGLMSSYMDMYKGNPKPSKPKPKDQQTFVEYSKTFIDWLHGQLYNDQQINNQVVSRSLVGIHYYMSILFLEKGSTKYPNPIKKGTYKVASTADSYDGEEFDWDDLFERWVK